MTDCRRCRGDGEIQRGRGFIPCPVCEGSGIGPRPDAEDIRSCEGDDIRSQEKDERCRTV